MLERILTFSIERRGLTVALVLALAAAGGYALTRLPIDAVPDITNVQVQINTMAPALSPPEMEKQVTFVVETALAGIPDLESTRSLTRNGFSQVTAVFRDGTDIYFARQQVNERLSSTAARLPAGVEPRLGPITTGLGEVVMWTVEFEHPDGHGASRTQGQPGWQPDGSYLTPDREPLRTPLERTAYLREVQDWIIRPQLVGIEGVASIDVIGGYAKQYHVQPNVWELAGYGLTFDELIRALERNNLGTGAGYLELNGEAYNVRASGRLHHADEIGGIVVAEREGVPIHVRDVASVAIGRELRTGSASENGEEVVVGTALMLVGANSRTVSAAVTKRLDAVARTLPVDIRVTVVLDRSALVDATIRTVVTNLGEGAVLVIVVLFLVLGNLRAALIAALAIPLSMLLTAIGMVSTRTSGNLMSLGAIDFGLIVDGAIIIVENCLRMLALRQSELGRALTRNERLAVIKDASLQVRSATAFGEAIIITVYVPILFLTGIEGKMFQPMARTVIFALVAAFFLSLTFVPAMMALIVTGPVRERDRRVMAAVSTAYQWVLRYALRWRLWVLGAALVMCLGAAVLFGRLGQEFAPTLRELDVLIQAFRLPGTGLQESSDMQRVLERAIVEEPEVALVFSRTGTGDMATDPMPPYASDTFVILRPRAAWPDPSESKEAVEERLAAAIARIPGNTYELMQPIQMRFNELLAGVRSDVAVKLFGDEFDTLLPVAQQIGGILAQVPGAVDVRVEPIAGAPVLSVEVDRAAVGRYGLDVADVHEVVATAIGGRHAGQIFVGDRRFDIVVRLPDSARRDVTALEHLPVLLRHRDQPPPALIAVSGRARDGSEPPFVPLEALATLSFTEGPNQISREDGKRRVVIQANVRGRDIASVVDEAQARIAAHTALPPGTWMTWGGQFEHLAAAKRRLAVVVPICLAVIFALLYATFGRARDAAIVFTGVPLALSGGVVALWLRAMPFSISAAVGFIALSGVAVLNGLVMVTFIEQLRAAGTPLEAAILRGAVTRLRPVLLTALVASLGFVPMALGTGTGAEVQRPLATVVIGGLLSSTLLTLVVLPALYRAVRSEESGVRSHRGSAE